MITNIFSFLVHPGKGLEEQPNIGGADIPLNGRLFSMLEEIFNRSEFECKTEISFDPSDAGQQQNDFRDELITLLQQKNIVAARKLAIRLQSVTDRRSGLGLFFLIIDQENNRQKALLSRFPADIGVWAEENQQTLRIEFLERVFMKNAKYYKAALYSGESFSSGFWDGYVVDKQLYTNANYWIREFLLSDFKTTSAAGTKRLAESLKKAMNLSENPSVKGEIAAAARLAYNINGQTTSVELFCRQYNLSQEAHDAILSNMPHDSLSFDQFVFCVEEFQRRLPFRSIELNTGAIMTAPVSDFEECFTREELPDTDGEYIFKTQGKIVGDKFKGRK